MDFDKLYKSLVVGGAMLATSCAATDTTTRSAPEPAPAAAQAAEAPKAEADNCSEVCSNMEGSEVICPDPATGGTNCCWLMSEPHPCCPS